MTFKEWFYSEAHRTKYTNDDPAYLAAQEAWDAAHEACANLCLETYPTIEGAMCASAIRARGNQ